MYGWSGVDVWLPQPRHTELAPFAKVSDAVLAVWVICGMSGVDV
jgi:hypothetical protein